MFPRVIPLLRAGTRVEQARRMSHGYPAHWKPMRQICEENKNHMNFMPVPEGAWQDAYNKQNSKWNILLAASIVSVIVTAGVLWQSGSVYFHSAPPMYNNKKKE